MPDQAWFKHPNSAATQPCFILLHLTLLAGAVLVSLAFNRDLFGPFEGIQAPLLHGVAVFLVPSLCLAILHTPREALTQKQTALLCGLLILTACSWGVSTVWGSDAQQALWGHFHRYTGLTTLSCLLIVCIASFLSFQSMAKVEHFLATLILCGLVAAILAVMQQFNLFYVFAEGATKFAGRVFSTQGNPILLSSLLILSVLCHLYFFFRKVEDSRKLARNQAVRRPVAAIGLTVSLAAHLLALFSARSDGPLIGLAAGLFFILVMVLLWKNMRRTCMALCASAIFMVYVLALALLADLPAQAKHIQAVSAMQDLIHSPTKLVRMHVWDSVLAMLQDRPRLLLTGTGADCLANEVARYTAPVLQTLERALAYIDRAHNGLLHALAEHGLLGFMSLYLLFCSAVLALLRPVFPRPGRADVVTFVLLVSVNALLLPVVVYLARGDLFYAPAMFGVGTLAGVLCWFIVLAARAPHRPRSVSVREENRQAAAIVVAGILLANFTDNLFGIASLATMYIHWACIGLSFALAVHFRPGNATGPEAAPASGRHGPCGPPGLASCSSLVLSFVLTVILTVAMYSFFTTSNSGFVERLNLLAVMLGAGLGALVLRSFWATEESTRLRPKHLALLLGAYLGLVFLHTAVIEPVIADILVGIRPSFAQPPGKALVSLYSFPAIILLTIVFFTCRIAFMDRTGDQTGQPPRPPARNLALLSGFSLFLALAAGLYISQVPAANVYTKHAFDLEKTNDLAGAVQVMHRALALNDRYANRHYLLYQFITKQAGLTPDRQARMDLLDQAATQLEQGITRFPREPSLYVGASLLSMLALEQTTDARDRAVRLERAVHAFERAMQITPNNVFLIRIWADTLTKNGFEARAVAQWENLLNFFPDDVAAHQQLARLYLQLGMMDQARREAKYFLSRPDLMQADENVRRLVDVIMDYGKTSPRSSLHAE